MWIQVIVKKKLEDPESSELRKIEEGCYEKKIIVGVGIVDTSM